MMKLLKMYFERHEARGTVLRPLFIYNTNVPVFIFVPDYVNNDMTMDRRAKIIRRLYPSRKTSRTTTRQPDRGSVLRGLKRMVKYPGRVHECGTMRCVSLSNYLYCDCKNFKINLICNFMYPLSLAYWRNGWPFRAVCTAERYAGSAKDQEQVTEAAGAGHTAWRIQCVKWKTGAHGPED